MGTRIKICCIASREEAALAIAAGADAVGLVGRMPSGPGPIADELIADIALAVPPPIASFLLTSETGAEAIIAHACRTGTNTLQLVDRLEDGAHAALRRALPALRLVQVIHVEDRTAVALAREVAPAVDALLLDSGRPGASVRVLGGTGRTHDWTISRAIVEAVERPVFLAGGLDAANVGEALATVRPFGVDLCTGVRNDGRLDPVKLRAFVAAVRRADRDVEAHPG